MSQAAATNLVFPTFGTSHGITWLIAQFTKLRLNPPQSSSSFSSSSHHHPPPLSNHHNDLTSIKHRQTPENTEKRVLFPIQKYPLNTIDAHGAQKPVHRSAKTGGARASLKGVSRRKQFRGGQNQVLNFFWLSLQQSTFSCRPCQSLQAGEYQQKPRFI